MRVLVAGATGAVGSALVPELVRRGHIVGGMARHPNGVTHLGGLPFAADALDINAVDAVFDAFKPDAVVHQLTSLPKISSLWKFDRDFAQTNRLRRDGTDILLHAARSSGVKRFVAQSFCGWPAARVGGPVKTEDDPLDPEPAPPASGKPLDAVRYLEQTVVNAVDVRGVVLRYGSFYGPGTHLARDSFMTQQVRRRLMPIIGDGGGIWSFSHIADVAEATAIAVEGQLAGTFNVVDDDPAPVAEWLPYFATILRAKAPRRLPSWIAKLLLPEHICILMTEARGGSNTRFKDVFGWKPRFASWRSGFLAEFG